MHLQANINDVNHIYEYYKSYLNDINVCVCVCPVHVYLLSAFLTL